MIVERRLLVVDLLECAVQMPREPVISYGRVVLDSVEHQRSDQGYPRLVVASESQVYEVSQLLLVSYSCVV